MAEDETSFQGKAVCLAENYCVIGSYGGLCRNAKDHKCIHRGMGVKIGSDHGAYQRIEKAFSNLKKDRFLRVIVIYDLDKTNCKAGDIHCYHI